ncbi:MAG: hypothetical protein ABI690_16885 [Chloroflexota bacterium]
MSRMNTTLKQVWYVYPPVAVTVKASRMECLRALAMASKPDVKRLHLRNLFTDGRRYYVEQRKSGFRLTSNSTIPWRRRARTAVAAVIYAEFSDAGEGGTRILMRSRMRLFYLGEALLIPGFITSLLVYTPWSKALILALILTLFGLSWLSHRLTATLQATEMVYFVEKALEDIAPVDIPILGATTEPEYITQDRAFREQWSKFYEAHKGEAEGERDEVRGMRDE